MTVFPRRQGSGLQVKFSEEIRGLHRKPHMIKLTLLGLFFIFLLLNGCGSPNGVSDSPSYLLASRVQFATIDKAKELLTTEDDFTNSWSQFDIDSRLKKNNGTKQELFGFISSQIQEWSISEKDTLFSLLQNIDNDIKTYGFKIHFPDTIFFVKSTANEEGGAQGYTRANYVVLQKIDTFSLSKNALKPLIIHELFHILTRNDSVFRRDMYKIIGFEIMNTISYPDSIKNLRITNPDAPQTDSYITLNKEGASIDCMMVLYSGEDYNGGDLFDYLHVGFLKLKGAENKEVDYVNEKPIIYTFNEISNFYEQVGRNTSYTIHPEEILAENFVSVIFNEKGLPSQWIIERMQEKLKQ
jgi:hypothetical protein